MTNNRVLVEDMNSVHSHPISGPSLDSLWAQAEYLGHRVTIDTELGSGHYRASITLRDWSTVKGRATERVHDTLAHAIRKATLLSGDS